MLLKYLIKNTDKRKRIAHFSAGIVILLHAYNKYESDHEPYKAYLVAGLVFLIVAFFHPALEKKLPWIDGFFLVIEGLLSIIVVIEAIHVGKTAIPITYGMLAIFQFYMAMRRGKKGMQSHRLKQAEHVNSHSG